MEQANWEESYMKTRRQVPFIQVEDVDSLKLVHELKSKGVTRLNSVLSELQVETLRDYILTELRTCANMVNDGTVASSELFGNIKMSDEARWDLKLPYESPIVSDILHSILKKGSILGDTLQGVTDKNGGGEFYELSTFVTTTGAKRQVIHSDTLWSVLPTLFTVTIALQDTDQTMGPTVFIPDTISEDVYIKRVYDHWTEPLKTPHMFSDLNAGDAAIYDSRLLHCGGANRSRDKPARILFYFTVRYAPKSSKMVDKAHGLHATSIRDEKKKERGGVSLNLKDFL